MSEEIKNEKKNVQVQQKENQVERNNEGFGLNGYHPFWSLFNDCFSDEEPSNVRKSDIIEDDQGYKLEIEVPGVDKKNIRISLDKGYLSINAHIVKNKNQEGGKRKYLHSERYEGSFTRSFYVGNDIKRSDIEATVNNGLLIVHIKKPAQQSDEQKYIEIK